MAHIPIFHSFLSYAVLNQGCEYKYGINFCSKIPPEIPSETFTVHVLCSVLVCVHELPSSVKEYSV